MTLDERIAGVESMSRVMMTEISELQTQVYALHDQVAETRAVLEDIQGFLKTLFPSREIKG